MTDQKKTSYETPECEIILLHNTDVIITSYTNYYGDVNLPIAP